LKESHLCLKDWCSPFFHTISPFALSLQVNGGFITVAAQSEFGTGRGTAMTKDIHRGSVKIKAGDPIGITQTCLHMGIGGHVTTCPGQDFSGHLFMDEKLQFIG
jgi:hypothetical protein